MEPSILDRIKNSQSKVWDLIISCCRLYMHAARIVGNLNEDYDRIREYEIKGWDYYHISILMPCYNVICTRYIKELNDPQIKLFPNENLDPVQEWESWFWHRFRPMLLTNEVIIQKNLKAIKLVYSRNPERDLEDLNKEMLKIEIQREYDISCYKPTIYIR